MKKAIQVLRRDPKLRPVIDKVGKFQIKQTRNRYQSLVEAIVTQQLSGSAARSILARFRAQYESRFPRPTDVLNTSDAKLRKVGLSSMKVTYIKELSEKIENKEIRFEKFRSLGDEEIISQLVTVKGIGRWTAEMFLIFSLGRMDVLPVGDLGLQKGVRRLYSLSYIPKPREIEEIAEPWRPYRTVATWYLWKMQQFDDIG